MSAAPLMPLIIHARGLGEEIGRQVLERGKVARCRDCDAEQEIQRP